MSDKQYHSGEGRCDDPRCHNDCHRPSAEPIAPPDAESVARETYEMARQLRGCPCRTEGYSCVKCDRKIAALIERIETTTTITREEV